MDQLKKSLPEWLNKYKFVILIVVIGIVLMMLPGKETSKKSENYEDTSSIKTESMESRIENILTCIYGAGEVDVLLTVAEGEEICYQKNEDIQIGDNNESHRTDTVITVDTERNESGLVRQIVPPKYLGAVIVCQGAEDPTVRLAIVDAVAKATGLGADRISVLKMK